MVPIIKLVVWVVPFTSSLYAGEVVPIPNLELVASMKPTLDQSGAVVVPLPIRRYPAVPPAVGA